ncbi:hypothetical protein [Clostridium ihumii]|uniref:hypothetical protein n=1 Tax=Clostridium ihumii TaxID=1470356 RepID=UPI00058C4129|nr:hypothetical protein [Clostridium ihumii]
MNNVNWLTVIISIVSSAVIVQVITFCNLNRFVKELSKIDEQYKIKLLDTVIETVSNRVENNK